MDYSGMTIEALRTKMEEVKAELYCIEMAMSRKRLEEKEKAWEDLRKAIVGYLRNGYNIFVAWDDSEVEITKDNVNLSDVGEILLKG